MKLGIGVSIVLGLVGAPGAAPQAADRVALVIGNSTYGENLDLDNPRNDAADVGGTLERLGFEVTTVLDVDQFAFNQALRDFTRRSLGADVAFVFYAGHGMEVDGINYVVPVNARLERDTDLRFAAVSLDDMLAATQGATLRVVVLDACRDNPLARTLRRTTSTRSMSRGSFGAVDEELLGDETLVAYAAAAGTTASDGTGSRNSPYTAALLEYLEQPLELSAMFRRVRARVLDTTDRTQRPHEYSSLLREHYLGGTSGVITPPALTELRLRQELAFWESIADSETLADFEAYLAQYPDGQFARLAENRAAALQEARVWAAIAASQNPADFAAYLEQHAEGRYAPLARQRFAALTAPPTPAPAPAPVEPAPPAIAVASAAVEPLPPLAGSASVRADPVPTEFGGTLRDCPACPEMVVLPSGTFRMGSTEGQADEQPVHEVRVESFALGRYEVTRAEFATFAAATGYTGDGCDVIDDDGSLDWDDRVSWQDPRFTQESRHPVVCVGWEAAEAYARWLSAETGERYRLPSEAEWEYAARAGTVTRRYWDSGSQCEHGNGSDRALMQRWPGWPLPVVNCVDGAPYTSEVGSYNRNAFGLHDMLGNVWEWTADCLHGTYRGAPSDGSVWTRGGDCERRVLRGGSWETTLAGIRAANRYSRDNRASNASGFRVARELR
ncbi:MAG: SUMF1/EgtB/PvdO family nonheme iron enzyme [Acidobacteria bacterium]|nr:SUMF1/EgtB/PvdO family nonheme iron enzyme [Acidobacteriota bacterium]